MEKKILTLIILIIIAGIAYGQSIQEIEGLWRGDKALGDVVIHENGSGFIVFDGNPDLKMNIKIEIKDNKYIITQNEPNQVRFYLAFNPFLRKELTQEQAKTLEKEARLMKWVFSLTNNGKKLSGTKYTTGWSMDGVEFLVNNDYSRASEWDKLVGQLDKPEISISGDNKKTVSITHPRNDIKIFYTEGDSAPVAYQSKEYSGSFTVSDSTTIQAIAVLKEYMNSGVAKKSIIIEKKNDANNVQTQYIDDFEIKLTAVYQKGDKIWSEYLVTYQGDKTEDWIGFHHARIIDTAGKDYRATYGGTLNPGSGWGGISCIKDVPMIGKVPFDVGSVKLDKIAVLDIEFRGRGKLYFRNLTVEK